MVLLHRCANTNHAMKTLLLSALVGVIMLCCLGCSPNSSQTYCLYARFQKLQGVKPGDPVRMGDVQVGHVTSTAFDPAAGDARVTMAISRAAVVKTDSTAVIAAAVSPAGSYIVLSVGTSGAPQAQDGSILKAIEPTAPK